MTRCKHRNLSVIANFEEFFIPAVEVANIYP